MITLFRNVKVLSNKLDNYANLLYIVVGDPGKALPLLFDQTKYFFLTGPLSPPPPPLSKGLDDRAPSLSQGLDPSLHCKCTCSRLHMHVQ